MFRGGVPTSQADQGVFRGHSGFWSVPGVFHGVPFHLLFRILQTRLCGFAKLLFGLSNLLSFLNSRCGVKLPNDNIFF